MLTIIIIASITFWLGLIVGFSLLYILNKNKAYTGELVITKTEEKTVYSLEILDFSEIEEHNEVVFKVVMPDVEI